MDPVSISGRQGQTVTSARCNRNNNESRDQGNGYEWNIPLDEVFDCDSAPECCQKFYYKHRNVSKKTRVAIAFVIVGIAVVITAIVVRFSLGPVNVLLGAGDQRPIVGNEDNFSPLLCSQYKVTASNMISNPVPLSSPSSSSTSSTSSSASSTSSQSSVQSLQSASEGLRFTAYMLLDTPYKNYRTNSYVKEETMLFPSDNYLNYWALYLSSGSEVTVSLCAANHTEIKLTVVQGRNEIEEIINHGDVPETADHVFGLCTSLQQNSYRFSVNSGSDDFGFVFTLEETGVSGGDAYTIPLSFSVRRSALVFDKYALYAECKDMVQCSLPMPNQADAVMLTMRENATTWPINVRAECVPAIGMYCAFFVGIPVGIAVILLSCVGVLYLCEQSILRDVERADRLRNTMASRSSSFGGRRSSQRNTETSTNSTTARRSFRTTTSPRAPLVDHDVMSAMAEVNRQRDLPPLYGDIKRVSTAVSDNDRSQSDNDEPPPTYDSVAT
ncbi:uncharacterized protein [Diadema antillarum]|uniref:uncharacterized protein n=1 Tax=Diadema antillarum TaxID=105358 RepID=UPI003A855EAD